MNKLIATLVAATFAMGTAFAQTATSPATAAVKATPPAMPTAVAAPVSVTPVKATPAIAATTTVTPVAHAAVKPAAAAVVVAKADVPVSTKHAKLHAKKVTHKATEKQPVVVAAAKPATVAK